MNHSRQGSTYTPKTADQRSTWVNQGQMIHLIAENVLSLLTEDFWDFDFIKEESFVRGTSGVTLALDWNDGIENSFRFSMCFALFAITYVSYTCKLQCTSYHPI